MSCVGSRDSIICDRATQIVEWRFFGGMTEDEVAPSLGVTSRTIRRDWQKACAFLHRELQAAERA